MTRRWTQKEIGFLITNHQRMNVKKIAKKLRRSEDAVRAKIRKLGLKKQPATELQNKIYEAFIVIVLGVMLSSILGDKLATYFVRDFPSFLRVFLFGVSAVVFIVGVPLIALIIVNRILKLKISQHDRENIIFSAYCTTTAAIITSGLGPEIVSSLGDAPRFLCYFFFVLILIVVSFVVFYHRKIITTYRKSN